MDTPTLGFILYESNIWNQEFEIDNEIVLWANDYKPSAIDV